VSGETGSAPSDIRDLGADTHTPDPRRMLAPSTAAGAIKMNFNDHDRISVLVMHAEPLIAVGLAAALRQFPGFSVQVHGGDGPPAEAIDVIVADYLDGVQLASALGKRAPSLKAARVLVMTMHDREHEVRLALEAGVHGYLLLGCPIQELIAGVCALGRGSRYLCLAVAQRMAESLTREALTPREADVLRLLVRGQCNKSIAKQLDIAVGTVKAHVKAIMGKLDASSRTQAASVAAQRGLIDGLAADGSTATRHLGNPRSEQSAGYQSAQFA
jgi:DNA-binding NarL/FixJ family response regulator